MFRDTILKSPSYRSMVTHLPVIVKWSNRGQVQIAALQVLHNRAHQALKQSPRDCEKSFFNTTNFHRFRVPLLKLFSAQLTDQTDSDSQINTLLLHLLNF